MAKTFEKLLDSITVTEYRFADSPETCYILEDIDSGCVCIGTNGDPIWFDSREDAEDQGCYTGIELGCSYTMREFLQCERRADPDTIEDDEEFLSLLSLGNGESDWLRTMIA